MAFFSSICVAPGQCARLFSLPPACLSVSLEIDRGLNFSLKADHKIFMATIGSLFRGAFSDFVSRICRQTCGKTATEVRHYGWA